MNRKTLFAALACALLIFSMLGCGTSNHLQTITLSSSGGGFFNVKGEGGTLQLVATGNYSSGKTRDLTNQVTYSVTVSPDGDVLPTPPLSITTSATGLMTAVEPFICTWHDAQPDLTKAPVWELMGSYKVTASFQGITSQPVYVGVGSAAGDGPGGACGP